MRTRHPEIAAKQRRAANVACGASHTFTVRPRLQSCGAATAGNPNLRQRLIFLRSLLRSLGVWARIGSCGLRRTLHSLRVVAPRLLREFAEGLSHKTDNTHQRTPTAFHNKAHRRAAHAGLAVPSRPHTSTGFYKLVLLASIAFALSGCTMITGRLGSKTHDQVAEAAVLELETAGRKVEQTGPESVRGLHNTVSWVGRRPHFGGTLPSWVGDSDALRPHHGELMGAEINHSDQQRFDSMLSTDGRDAYYELAGGEFGASHNQHLPGVAPEPWTSWTSESTEMIEPYLVGTQVIFKRTESRR